MGYFQNTDFCHFLKVCQVSQALQVSIIKIYTFTHDIHLDKIHVLELVIIIDRMG